MCLSLSKAVHSERGPFIAGAGEHTSLEGSSSRMSEPVFFHTVANWTPSAYRGILHDKIAFVQLCVTVCLLQDLHTVSCITGAVVINSMNSSVTSHISCCKISNRCDLYPRDYDNSDSELAVELDRTIWPYVMGHTVQSGTENIATSDTKIFLGY